MNGRVARFLTYGAFLMGLLISYLAFWPLWWSHRDLVPVAIGLFATMAFFFEAYRGNRSTRITSDSSTGHDMDRVFWLGLPIILGLFWFLVLTMFVLGQLLAFGLIVICIIYGVMAISRSTPSGGLLSTYARYWVSMAFAVTVIALFFLVIALGMMGYLTVVLIWAGLFIVVRKFSAGVSESIR